ncbi:MAG TPA: PBP1A family penicillin-binding protein [Thermoanaerobaculia bacterium]|nr:PBP1A family penicillin-binding protein [Thermoanaerobaculia bacterium]
MNALRIQAQRFQDYLATLSPARRRLMIGALATLGLMLVVGLAGSLYVWRLAVQFPEAPFKQPSRLYGRATQIEPGAPLGAGDMEAELQGLGYRESAGPGPVTPGTFRRAGDRLAVHLRPFPTPDGRAEGGLLQVTFRGGRVAGLQTAEGPAELASLPPPLLASYYSSEVEERRPVTLDDLPEEVWRTVLAAEDDGFFSHPGVSPTGLARAVWVNLRGGELEQGGSTITQQLVKNVYLSSERTLSRKAKEAVIAMLVELRHGKRAILEAYLNEIYWGSSGSANLIGLGAAAHAYFGKEAPELTLEEAATLAGMIQAPATYSPVAHPEKAKERRDWVLQRLADLEWVPQERVRRAIASPLGASPHKVVTRPLAPYFADFVKTEAEGRFDIEDLGGEGYQLFSDVSWRDQREAEKAVEKGLSGIDGWKKGKSKREPLQAALLSVDPRSGAILAYVGGRDYEVSQFDRVVQARRQAGSAFKPVVYAAAFTEGVATPSTLLRDSPITVKIDNKPWKPRNYDRGFQGSVTVRTALERSLNVPTVRLALQVGMPRLIDLAHDMGIRGEMEPVPSLSLGAVEVTTREMAEVYSTFASGGLRPQVHALVKVLDWKGEEMESEELDTPQRVLPAQSAYLVTSILQGVLERGTAAGVRAQVYGPLAGKTGTTNDRRDNWFAGYSPDRVTVVWVGYDDNRQTRLSGASAALPLWTRFTAAVRPPGGYRDFAMPPGIAQATIDPTTGQLATEFCPYAVTDVFPDWQVPTEPCRRHQPGYAQTWADSTVGNPMFDPVTGEPIDPYRLDPYLTEDGERLEITNYPQTAPAADPYTEDPADLETGTVSPVRPRPVRVEPLRYEPVEPSDDSVPEAGEEPGDGTILIRPSRQAQPQAAPPEDIPTDREPQAEPLPAPEPEPEPVTEPSVAPEPSPTPPPPA